MKIIDCENSKAELSVGIVVSRYNKHITEKLLQSAIERLKQKGILESKIWAIWVPGAIEIPIAIQRLAQKGSFDVLVALGCVIKGDTDHYHWVCEQVSQGVSQVSLQYDIPIGFGVLTTLNEEQALERTTSENNKAFEAIDAVIEMYHVLNECD